MKGKMLCTGILLFSCMLGQAQTGGKRTNRQVNTTTRSTDRNNSNTFSAVSASSYQARSDSSSRTNVFSIADPTIRALTINANGGDVRISNSGIVGMPKRAYGFANGHLYLSNKTATTSGTITGSGMVGTGSTLGSLGSSGPHLNINGKSPYAGSNMWGNAQGMVLNNADANIRPAVTRQ